MINYNEMICRTYARFIYESDRSSLVNSNKFLIANGAVPSSLHYKMFNLTPSYGLSQWRRDWATLGHISMNQVNVRKEGDSFTPKALLWPETWKIFWDYEAKRLTNIVEQLVADYWHNPDDARVNHHKSCIDKETFQSLCDTIIVSGFKPHIIPNIINDEYQLRIARLPSYDK